MNLIPILADARHPNSYRNMVPEVDLIYQDVAQREQAQIAMRNSELFLKKDGLLVLIIKSMSIDSAKKTGEIIDKEIKRLGEHFSIKGQINLERFHSDHAAVIASTYPLHILNLPKHEKEM
jgi:fibrillarin-like pre-rRNA processing protein